MAVNTSEKRLTDNNTINFNDTKIAFEHLSDSELKRAYWLFKAISNNFLVKTGMPVTKLMLNIGLPIKAIIKATIFNHFCGGETIDESSKTIADLAKAGVGTILDYSVEGEEEEKIFDATAHEIIKTIDKATREPGKIPFSVFKVSGVGRTALLEKLDKKQTLTTSEQAEWFKVKSRVNMICKAAHDAGIPVMIDAEESWIQKTIDQLALEMMKMYNRERVVVYNTYQLYRHDKLADLKTDFEKADHQAFLLGAKLVRGAYMEKERKRAAEFNYPSPIQPDKAATDHDYDAAIKFCVAHHDQIAFVAGTHNESSCSLLANLMNQQNISHQNPHIYFSQLLGMSDNLSFNLSNAGYLVAKYVPYGPVKAVMPYLMRRAEENTAIAGQMSRELSLIVTELKRRKKGT